jgi:hypothetical protein
MHKVSHAADWYTPQCSDPGTSRFPQLTTIAMVESRIEQGDKIETGRRSCISSRTLPASDFAEAVRGHRAIENNLHWTLDVTFNEDQSACAPGTGPRTWPWSAMSPTIWSANAPTNDRSTASQVRRR